MLGENYKTYKMDYAEAFKILQRIVKDLEADMKITRRNYIYNDNDYIKGYWLGQYEYIVDSYNNLKKLIKMED